MININQIIMMDMEDNQDKEDKLKEKDIKDKLGMMINILLNNLNG